MSSSFLSIKTHKNLQIQGAVQIIISSIDHPDRRQSVLSTKLDSEKDNSSQDSETQDLVANAIPQSLRRNCSENSTSSS